MIRKKIPGWQEITPVYGLIVLLSYGWMIYTFSWNFPAWILFQSTESIVVTFIYGLAFELIESTGIMLCIIFLCIILPSSWLRDDFVFTGGIFIILLLIGIMYTIHTGALSNITITESVFLASAIIIKLASLRYPVIKKPIETLADRSIIFIYISLPSSIISLIIVIFRNLP